MFLCLSTTLFAQQNKYLKDTLFVVDSSYFIAHASGIVPGSVSIFQVKDSDEFALSSFSVLSDTIFLGSKVQAKDTVRIQYRTLAAPLFSDQKLLDSTLISKNPESYYDLRPDEGDRSTGVTNDLNYSGSFARGFSIGNRQDLVLNSDLDLQLSGKIGGEIDILAAISDQNIPLQPEGNTQNLREFDKVFIQLSKDQHKLLIGDYEIASDTSYYLNFFKKWQGVKYEDEFSIGNDGLLKTSVATAISRGKYNRNTLQIQEGNQGPYRLEGAEGENFIIVIAATERVYLDGVLLVRGIEKDYTIDYNTAEITFTPNLLITKDVRITIDFEYNNQNYLRSGTLIKGAYSTQKTKLYSAYYHEQDSRNSQGTNGVGIEQKQQLALLGDNLENRFGSSIVKLEDTDLNPITYRLIDSIVSDISYDSILVFSTQDNADLFTAQFSFVGPNSGNYVLVPGSNNGTIYQWVAPLGDIPQGDYAPLVQLSAPQKTAMLTIGGRHQFNKKWSIESELAASNQDKNRFSKLNNADNFGAAVFTAIHFNSDKKSDKLLLNARLSYDYVHKNFVTINPFRNAEFNRDWNLSKEATRSEQHLINGYIEVSKDDFFKLKIQSEYLDNAYGIQGFKQSANLFYSKKGFTLLAAPSFLKSTSPSEESTFWRPNFDAYQELGNSGLKLGFRTLIERNSRALASDSLSLESLYFSRYETYLENSASKKLHTKILLARRIDQLPDGKKFELGSTADELNLSGHWNAASSQQLNWNFIARNLKINNPDLIDQVDLQTYLGKLSYRFQLLKGVIRSTTAYELGSGQENKRSYIYLEVEPGKGIFQWVDYNADGIQQIEEFEIAPNIDQATFIRIERPTTDFIRTQNVLFNENLQLGLKPIWHDKKGLKKWVSKLSTTTNIQISRKNSKQENFAFWNPFNLDIENEGIVAAQSLIRNNLYFDRGNPKFMAYIGHSEVFSAQALDIGTLKNKELERYVHYQIKVKSWMNHTFDISSGTKSNDASIFQNRNYQIETFRINPALHFLFTKTFNATIQYRFENQDNLSGEQQSLTKNEFNFALGYQNISNRSIDLSLTFSEINFDGLPNDPVAFTMLDGLQNGRNLQWDLSANQRVAKNLQLLINYNGRKAGNLDVVHFGNVQIKATF